MSKDPAWIDEGRNIGRNVLRYHGAEFGTWLRSPEAKRIMRLMENGDIETYIPGHVISADMQDYYAEYVLSRPHP